MKIKNRKIKPNTGAIAVLSLLFGTAVALFYEPAAEAITVFFEKHFNNYAKYHDLFSLIIIATAIATAVYIISFITVSFFASSAYRNVIKIMNERQLLPITFKPKTRLAFKAVYSDLTAVIYSLVDMLQAMKKEKEKFAKTVEMYLDPIVKKEMESRGIHEVYIGGKKKTATVFFSDLRGFTSFTETHGPDKVLEVLNDYLSASTKIVDRYGGRVNKYMGDSVMAVFEEQAKYSEYNDADKAVMAALEIRDNFEIMMKRWKGKIDPMMSIGIGIGLARGEVVSGNIGSEQRMEHTVIGDKVNFASRLCSTAKNSEIIISDDIYSLLMDSVEVEMLAPCEIKGKTGVHNIYSVKSKRMLRQ